MTDREVMRRLEKLERDNRRLKRFGFAALVLAAALGAIYATRPVPDVIEAHAFKVVDAAGVVRVDVDENSLYFFNSTGRGTIRLINAQNGGGLEFLGTEDQEIGGKFFPVARMSLTTWGLGFNDRDGTSAIALGGRNPEGTNGKTLRNLDLYNAKGNPGAQVLMGKDDEPVISLLDDDVGPFVFISASRKHGSQVSLSGRPMGAGGGWAVSLNTAPITGEPSITLADSEGFQTNLGSGKTINSRTGETQQTSAASIVMFGNDKEHHVIWKAP